MNLSNSKKKLGVLDIVVIVLTISVIAVCMFKFYNDMGVGKESKYYITFTVSNVSSENADYLNDAEYYLSNDGQYFGKTVGSPVYTPSQQFVENDRGAYVAEYATDGSVDVKSTIEVTGLMTDSAFMLNGTTRLSNNMSIDVVTEYISLTVTITDIKAVQ